METTSAPSQPARITRPPGIATAVRQLLRAHWPEFTCALVLLIMATNLLAILPQKTITVDEFVHIPAGYAGLTRGDFRPNNEHPPLAKLWATLPLLALDAQSPPDLPAENPAQRTMNTARYFWEENAGDFIAITYWARVPMIALTAALGALIYLATRRTFGPRAAVLAVLLFSLEPTVLAHGRIVHTDIAAALAYLAAWLAIYAYLQRPTSARAAALGLVAGAALVTKYSLAILAPIVAIAVLGLLVLAPRRGLPRRPLLAHAALIALIALLTINATYGFRHQPLEPIDLAWIAEERPAEADFVTAAFDTLSPVIPPYYLLGVYTVLGHNAGGHQAALLGDHSQSGWWYYFPVAFALKTTLPFLLLTIAAIAWATRRTIARRDPRLIALLLPPALYTALAMTSQINIGIRHLLPIYPFLFILVAATLDRLLSNRPLLRMGGDHREPAAAGASVAAGRGSGHRSGGRRRWVAQTFRQPRGPNRATKRRPPRLNPPPARESRGAAAPRGEVVPRLLVALTLLWLAIEAARAHPNYLVYLNQLARGPSWHYLSDSNVEWGDDTAALAAYLHAQSETAVRAAVAGSRDTLGLFGVEYRDYFSLDNADTTTRYLAIGASFLNGSTVPSSQDELRPDYFATYRYRQPVAIFGRAIYLYPYPDAISARDTPLAPSAYRATLIPLRLPSTLRPGETFSIRVQVSNDGDTAWPSSDRGDTRYQIRLGNRWFDAGGTTLIDDDARAPLYHTLYPAERTDISLTITAPSQPGDYLLDIDLVQEGVAWFGSQGNPAIRVPVRVR